MKKYYIILLQKITVSIIKLDESSIKVNKINIKNIIIEAIEKNLIPLFIYGNETYGIPQNILNLRNILDNQCTLELIQRGIMPSYNVSNALSIISYYVMEVYNEL